MKRPLFGLIEIPICGDVALRDGGRVEILGKRNSRKRHRVA